MNKPNIHHFSMNNELFRSSDADASDAMNNSCIHRKNDEYSVIIFDKRQIFPGSFFGNFKKN